MPLVLPVLAAALSAAAQGGDAPDSGPLRVLVVPLAEQREGRLEELYAGLEAAGGRAVEADARAGVDLPVAPLRFSLARADDARAQLIAARAALRRLEVEAVDAALDGALDLLLSLEAPEDHKDLFADVLLLRAEMALARGDTERARRDLRLLARLDPERADLHPGVHPPALVQAYAGAREDNQAAPLGALAVLPRAPPGLVAEALLDGVPLPLGNTRPKGGPHLVTLRAPGCVPFSRVVDIDPGQPLLLDPFLSPLAADTARHERVARLRAGSASEDDLVTLLEITGASGLVLLSGDEVRTFSPSSGSHALPDSPDAIALGRAALEALRQPRAPPALPPAPEPPAPPSTTLDPALLAVGAGIALGVTAAAAGAATWYFWPAEPVTPPPRPVVISCCTTGRR